MEDLIVKMEKYRTVVGIFFFFGCVRSQLRHTGSSLWHAGFSSCDTWALECVGSVVVAHWLSCPAACGILVPCPGIEPTSPVLEGGFLTTGPPRKSLGFVLEKEAEHVDVLMWLRRLDSLSALMGFPWFPGRVLWKKVGWTSCPFGPSLP